MVCSGEEGAERLSGAAGHHRFDSRNYQSTYLNYENVSLSTVPSFLPSRSAVQCSAADQSGERELTYSLVRFECVIGLAGRYLVFSRLAGFI